MYTPSGWWVWNSQNLVSKFCKQIFQVVDWICVYCQAWICIHLCHTACTNSHFSSPYNNILLLSSLSKLKVKCKFHYRTTFETPGNFRRTGEWNRKSEEKTEDPQRGGEQHPGGGNAASPGSPDGCDELCQQSTAVRGQTGLASSHIL